MTTLWTDDPDAAFDESDALWGDEDAEGDLGGEDFGEESRDARRRRERARRNRIALRQQQQAAARAKAVQRRQPSAVSPQRSTAQAVRTLGLENKVQEDAFRSAIAGQNKRLSRAEYAAVLTALVAQGMASFETPNNPYVAAALRYAPLVVLDPPPKGHGVEALIKDPRVLGAAAVAGLVFAGDHWGSQAKTANQAANQIKISAPSTMALSESPVTLMAYVLDSKGRPLSGVQQVTWSIDNLPTTPPPANVNPSSGVLTATAACFVVVRATSQTSPDIYNTADINIQGPSII
jgi:hypothetical protein